VLWIRIEYRGFLDPDSDSQFGSKSGSGSKRAKMAQKEKKPVDKFIFCSAGCSPLRAEGFPCSLDVLYGGLYMQFLKKKISPLFFSGSGSVSRFNESASTTLPETVRNKVQVLLSKQRFFAVSVTVELLIKKIVKQHHRTQFGKVRFAPASF
jgi:hypothetical protein